MGQSLLQMGQLLLQIRAAITKWAGYYKSGQALQIRAIMVQSKIMLR